MFYLALRYLRHNALRSAIMTLAMTVMIALPLGLEVVLAEAETLLRSRADTTPLVVGAKGSPLNLVLRSLYFSGEAPEQIASGIIDEIEADDLALAVPLHLVFDARSAPVVGTTVDYFDLRNLRFANGRPFAVLGEAVAGASAAQRLGLAAGGSVVAGAGELFDLAGAYPLQLSLAGVLAPSSGPDDDAIFVDVNTAWTIQGLYHGHQDLTAPVDPSVILKRDGGSVTANAKLFTYDEVTAGNRETFHGHGDPGAFPVSSILVFPNDARAGALVQGRLVGPSATVQAVRPGAVIEDLLQTLFRVRDIVDAAIAIVGAAMVAVLGLVVMLSIRLRQDELDTIHRIGSSRWVTPHLLGAELIIVAGVAVILSAVLLFGIQTAGETIARALVLA